MNGGGKKQMVEKGYSQQGSCQAHAGYSSGQARAAERYGC